MVHRRGLTSRQRRQTIPAERPRPRDRSQQRDGQPRGFRSQAHEHYLRKLGRLRRYVEVATLVESEETRQTVLQRLDEIRETWQSGPHDTL